MLFYYLSIRLDRLYSRYYIIVNTTIPGVLQITRRDGLKLFSNKCCVHLSSSQIKIKPTTTNILCNTNNGTHKKAYP